MNPHQKPQEDVVVTQEDREAAYAFLIQSNDTLTVLEKARLHEMRQGAWDRGPAAQAFARHRVLGHEAGRRDMREAAEWQPIETAPDEPCNVLLICAPFEWVDQAGKPVPCEPMRDELERMELGFWDGAMWCEAGTGHDIVADDRPSHLMPTHWQALPTEPLGGEG